MVHLAPVEYGVVSRFFWEFQKKSKCFEMPPEESEIMGIFNEKEMIGYFILIGYDHTFVEVNQGYLKPEYRHLGLSKECIQRMEELCKAAGYKEVRLGTHNRFKAYLQFMKDNGYTPEHLTFHKNLGEN